MQTRNSAIQTHCSAATVRRGGHCVDDEIREAERPHGGLPHGPRRFLAQDSGKEKASHPGPPPFAKRREGKAS